MLRRLFVVHLAVLALLAAACSSDPESGVVAEAQTESQVASEVSEDASEVEPASDSTEVDESTAGSTAEPDPTPTPEPDPTAVPADASTAPDETSPSGNGCGAGAAAGQSTESLDFEDRERVYEQLVPKGYDDETPLPVVLNWHGLGSSGPEQLAFSDYVGLANDETFIVIAPTGVPSPGTTQNSWELEPNQDPARDDLAFAHTLLDTVIQTLCVDETRVYTTGMSNGGYFSSVLVCEMSERIAAAASVAALSHPDDCEPERTVPYIGFHGTEDLVVPFDGSGETSLAPGQIVDLFLLKIPEEFAEFAETAGCDLEPVVTDESDNVVSYDYQNCPAGVEMTFYEIQEAGHTWPGSALSLAISEAVGLGVTSDEISASRVSWEFFEQHSLPAP